MTHLRKFGRSLKSVFRRRTLDNRNELTSEFTDQLTRIPNRLAFDQAITRRMSDYRRDHQSLSLILIDIDFFGTFDQQQGNTASDQILKLIAKTLSGTIRENDFCARLEESRFGVLFSGASLCQAKIVAERMRRSIGALSIGENSDGSISIGVGITQALFSDSDTAIIDRAELAVQQAKEIGPNQIACQTDRLERSDAGEVTQPPIHATVQQVDVCESVTGLPFLKIFQAEMARRVHESERTGVSISMAILNMGTPLSGGEPEFGLGSNLATVSSIIQRCIRKSDLATWYSDNEFAIFLPNTCEADAILFAKRLNKSLESSRLRARCQIRIGELVRGETELDLARRIRMAPDQSASEINGRPALPVSMSEMALAVGEVAEKQPASNCLVPS